MEESVSRRHFLRTAAMAGLGFAGLRQLMQAQGTVGQAASVGFGPLERDPVGIFSLPRGFRHQVIAMAGQQMADGLMVPARQDGMAAFPGPDGLTVLVCNHEVEADWTHLGPLRAGNRWLGRLDRSAFYDYGRGEQPCLGGTTNIVYDTRRQEKVRQFLSLMGTERNCAGGPTPWGTWITCEESAQKAVNTYEQDHGYNFEVTAHADPRVVKPVPLKAMGRFRHEAIAVDPRSGIVYQTEDLGDGLLYRFIPEVPGQLAKGGRLQALMLRGAPGRDTRNWPDLGGSAFPLGQPLPVEWVDLDDVESPRDDLRYRGHAAGAAVFARGEGCWYGDEAVYICCTNGGPELLGQVWRYVPSPVEGTAEEARQPGTLELFVESTDREMMKNGDNICVAPWGDLIVAEDSEPPSRLIGVTPQGQTYVLAQNILNGNELAGPCFSPDGSTLFVNIQTPGMTLAVTGPWPRARFTPAG